jgi:hypothetical protein
MSIQRGVSAVDLTVDLRIAIHIGQCAVVQHQAGRKHKNMSVV